MGLALGFLNFFLTDIAWPLFALGYPLYASIWAVEANSKRQMRKLITYWIIFTLISLFELGVAKLIERVPFWPIIKLVVIVPLVLPHFSGALYVYRSFIHPFLYIDMQVAIRQLHRPKIQISFKQVTSVDEAQKFPKENRCKDTQKNYDQEPGDAKPNLREEEVKSNSITEKEMAGTTQVGTSQGVTVETVANSFGPEEVKEVATQPMGANSNLPEIPASDSIKKKWTCDICLITITCENNLNGHFQGKGHRKKCEELNLSTPTGKSVNSSPPDSAEKTKCQAKQISENEVMLAKGDHSESIAETSDGKEEKNSAMLPNDSQRKLPEMPPPMNVQKEWTSSSEKNLDDHLHGKKHKDKGEELKASKQTAKSTNSSSPTFSPPNSAENTPYQARRSSENEVKHTDGGHKAKASTVKEIKEPEIFLNAPQSKQPEALPSVKVQKEWTCAMCQVKTSSEKNLKDHLVGQKHRAKCMELKEAKKKAKAMNGSSTANGSSQQGNGGSQKHRQKVPVNCDKNMSTKLHCIVCNISCPSDSHLAAHLQGKKHLATIQQIADNLQYY